MRILRAALVTPLTGPLALYGKTCATALTLWAKQVALLPTGFSQVELEVQDSADDLHHALQRTLDRRPDVLFGPYGSSPMLQVARSCTRPVWNHGGASSQLARPAFPHVITVLAPASTYFAEVLSCYSPASSRRRARRSG